MPPMRIAVCFDGWIVIHDHIPTNTLRALSPSPLSYMVCFVPCAFLFTIHQSIHTSNKELTALRSILLVIFCIKIATNSKQNRNLEYKIEHPSISIC